MLYMGYFSFYIYFGWHIYSDMQRKLESCFLMPPRAKFFFGIVVDLKNIA